VAQLNDIVQDTTATTGTGSYTLSGTAPTGRQTFAATVGVGNTVYYRALDTAGNWEIGLGTLSATTTLARTAIIASSNAGAAVNWGAGNKTVINILPSSKAVYLDTNNQVQLAAGAVGAPTLSWVGYVATGLYRPAADTIGFSAAGTERARVTTTGMTVTGTLNATTALNVASVAVPTISSTDTLTNKRVNPRVVTAGTTLGSMTPTGDTADQYVMTGLTGAITIAVPSGTPVDGQKLTLRILDNGTARAITWTTTTGGFRAINSALPTTTVISKVLYVGCIYNNAAAFWDVVAVSQQA